MVVAGVLHSEWDENFFLQECFVAFSCNTLENRSEKEKPGIVVVELRTGLELQVAAAEFFYKIVDGVVVARNVGKEFGIVGVAGDTGGMAEQLADGNF